MDTELVFVPKDLMGNIRALGDITELTKEHMYEIIKTAKKEIESYNYCLDEDVLQFRVHAERVRNSYKITVEEEIEKTRELWATLDKTRYETHLTLERTENITKNIKHDIADIQKALNNVNIYGVNTYLELVKEVVNMTKEQREIMEKLLDIKRMD